MIEMGETFATRGWILGNSATAVTNLDSHILYEMVVRGSFPKIDCVLDLKGQLAKR